MKIPNKEDLKNYVISVQKGLQEIPQEVKDLKEDLHKASTTSSGFRLSTLPDASNIYKPSSFFSSLYIPGLISDISSFDLVFFNISILSCDMKPFIPSISWFR